MCIITNRSFTPRYFVVRVFLFTVSVVMVDCMLHVVAGSNMQDYWEKAKSIAFLSVNSMLKLCQPAPGG